MDVSAEWKITAIHGGPTVEDCPVLARYKNEYYIAVAPVQVGKNSDWVSIADILPKKIKMAPPIEVDGYLYQRTQDGNIYRKKVVSNPDDSKGFVLWKTTSDVEELLNEVKMVKDLICQASGRRPS